MLTILSCVALDHSYPLLAAAFVMCILGSVLTMRLYARVRRTRGVQKLHWLFLSGSIGGSTIWSTHFIAMISYRMPLDHAYDPLMSLLSLAIAVGFTLFGFAVTAGRQTGATIELGGGIVGLGIVAMHYVGMAAFLVAGIKTWDPVLTVAAVVCSVGFGAVATNRIARPVTRFCKYGGAVSLILAIASLHFTAMAGMTVVPDPTISIPAMGVSESGLAAMVLLIMGVMLALGASAYIIDLNSNQMAAERYRHLSLHDALTGLPNRNALYEHVGETMRQPRDDTARMAVVAIGVNRFKDVNDAHGQAVGDRVLREIAENVSGVLQPGEFLARNGGDEFVAVRDQFFMKADAKDFAERILSAVNLPMDLEGQAFRVTASAGIALFPGSGQTATDILAQADLAMQRAKMTGPTVVRFYKPSMDAATRDRSLLSIDLHHAIDRGELELFYQPQNDVLSREIIGYEVLLRWRHPTRGMVSPAEFIPLAERTGFIQTLGDWVLETACREASSWTQPVRIAVNVASAQLADRLLPHRVRDILLQTGLAAERLELEITESGIIGDQQHALHIIRQLKAMGVKIAMDDYGTGYSSLSTLQNFPFDKIKIDRSFVDGIGRSRPAEAIVRSTIILARSLDIPVLAEGVETEEHMTFLQGEGCLQVQGYLFGKPQPLSDIKTAVMTALMTSAEIDPPASAEIVAPTPAVAA
ncbi:diguanylate cyclase [Rhizobium sp. Leaf384]|uniref:putative bifunctional diguanylate cyclase/phosphodiesterase n=1 Tax=unclassified Rhizobium TaxID=2613769 RepID=UPI000714383B|nr:MULTISPECIES: bifunctional diguanylate cyclase/phosphodiesterase [unclassified Rhizobium]KQS76898.1 diguanylate cyclase [Rhizobium sp. Leaf384]KQS78169.1 diguanylate cyclase [Rhizobium sp. Leaf383]